jgi:hypothetical protein
MVRVNARAVIATTINHNQPRQRKKKIPGKA